MEKTISPLLTDACKKRSGKVCFLLLMLNKPALKTHSFDYTLLPGSHEVDELYKVNSWPTSMVIGKKGNLKKVIQSSTKIREELGSAIDALR